MIESIQALGPLVHDTSLSGDRKADDTFPEQLNGTQISKNLWLLVFGTRGYRFMDDDRSVIYQLRETAPDGRLIREGYLSRSVSDWIPRGQTKPHYRQHGHPVVFGVPKGAKIDGKIPPQANLFAVKWRILGIPMDDLRYTEAYSHPTIGSEWIQIRLNDREDDIEVLEPIRPLRQQGLEQGEYLCAPRSGAPSKWVNQAIVHPVRFKADGSEWADINQFDQGRVAPMKYRYDAARHRYEWVETGPMLAGTQGESLFEASLIPQENEWVICARRRQPNGRRRKGSAWMRTADPFRSVPEPFCTEVPQSDCPIPAFRCADGVIRLFANDQTMSAPPRGNRNPLRLWEIDPVTFAASNHRVVYDTFDAGLPMSPACDPGVDLTNLLPHAGGRVQYLVHRLRTGAVDLTIPLSDQPVLRRVLASPREKECCGIYCEKLTYTESYPGQWEFA